jgi:hypothetical protein
MQKRDPEPLKESGLAAASALRALAESVQELRGVMQLLSASLLAAQAEPVPTHGGDALDDDETEAVPEFEMSGVDWDSPNPVPSAPERKGTKRKLLSTPPGYLLDLKSEFDESEDSDDESADPEKGDGDNPDFEDAPAIQRSHLRPVHANRPSAGFGAGGWEQISLPEASQLDSLFRASSWDRLVDAMDRLSGRLEGRISPALLRPQAGEEASGLNGMLRTASLPARPDGVN